MSQTVHIIQTPPCWLKTPPLSLVYLKNYLERKDITVQIHDLNHSIYKALDLPLNNWLNLNEEFENSLFSLIEQKAPDILNNLYQRLKDAQYIGISLFKRNAPFSFSLSQRIKQLYPDKEIIFGGPHTLSLKRKNKLDNTSYWVVGEGEKPLHKIVSGNPTKIHEFDEIENLDNLPFLDFGALNPKNYSSSIPLLSSRGCPHQCKFCSEKILSKKFRYHSPEYMVNHIQYLIVKYKIRNFVFCDSLINYKNQWLMSFCNLLIERDIKINWEAQIRITPNFPLGLASLMKKSGCFNLFIGLENGSNQVLETMNKGFDIDCASAFLNTLKKAGLHYEVSLIFGYPGETKDHFDQTVSFIKSNSSIIPKIAQVNPFVDYLDEYTQEFPTLEGKNRVKKFIELLNKENIKYTKSFINNLIY